MFMNTLSPAAVQFTGDGRGGLSLLGPRMNEEISVLRDMSKHFPLQQQQQQVSHSSPSSASRLSSAKVSSVPGHYGLCFGAATLHPSQQTSSQDDDEPALQRNVFGVFRTSLSSVFFSEESAFHIPAMLARRCFPLAVAKNSSSPQEEKGLKTTTGVALVQNDADGLVAIVVEEEAGSGNVQVRVLPVQLIIRCGDGGSDTSEREGSPLSLSKLIAVGGSFSKTSSSKVVLIDERRILFCNVKMVVVPNSDDEDSAQTIDLSVTRCVDVSHAAASASTASSSPSTIRFACSSPDQSLVGAIITVSSTPVGGDDDDGNASNDDATQHNNPDAATAATQTCGRREGAATSKLFITRVSAAEQPQQQNFFVKKLPPAIANVATSISILNDPSDAGTVHVLVSRLVSAKKKETSSLPLPQQQQQHMSSPFAHTSVPVALLTLREEQQQEEGLFEIEHVRYSSFCCPVSSLSSRAAAAAAMAAAAAAAVEGDADGGEDEMLLMMMMNRMTTMERLINSAPRMAKFNDADPAGAATRLPSVFHAAADGTACMSEFVAGASDDLVEGQQQQQRRFVGGGGGCESSSCSFFDGDDGDDENNDAAAFSFPIHFSAREVGFVALDIRGNGTIFASPRLAHGCNDDDDGDESSSSPPSSTALLSRRCSLPSCSSGCFSRVLRSCDMILSFPRSDEAVASSSSQPTQAWWCCDGDGGVSCFHTTTATTATKSIIRNPEQFVDPEKLEAALWSSSSPSAPEEELPFSRICGVAPAVVQSASSYVCSNSDGSGDVEVAKRRGDTLRCVILGALTRSISSRTSSSPGFGAVLADCSLSSPQLVSNIVEFSSRPNCSLCLEYGSGHDQQQVINSSHHIDVFLLCVGLVGGISFSLLTQVEGSSSSPSTARRLHDDDDENNENGSSSSPSATLFSSTRQNVFFPIPGASVIGLFTCCGGGDRTSGNQASSSNRTTDGAGGRCDSGGGGGGATTSMATTPAASMSFEESNSSNMMTTTTTAAAAHVAATTDSSSPMMRQQEHEEPRTSVFALLRDGTLMKLGIRDQQQHPSLSSLLEVTTVGKRSIVVPSNNNNKSTTTATQQAESVVVLSWFVDERAKILKSVVASSRPGIASGASAAGLPFEVAVDLLNF